MSILLVATDRNLAKLQHLMQQQLPEVDIYCWPDISSAALIEFAVLWKQPKGLLAQLPNLKAISSLGAGVDGILTDPDLSADIPVCRIVDPDLSNQMAEYVLSVVLAFKCKLPLFLTQQQDTLWRPSRRLKLNNIVILGVGEIGMTVAQRLHNNGFMVKGWSRREKHHAIIDCYCGEESLNELTQWADVIVSVLPVTPATKNKFDDKFFQQMKSTAFFINVGRGALVDEQALFDALQNNEIAGACLDVFKQEPLPQAHFLWSLGNLLITPHISAITDTETVINQLIENYKRLSTGVKLNHLIDKNWGY